MSLKEISEAKGLRQGDSLFPVLFLIFMVTHVLSNSTPSVCPDQVDQFCFVDDLIIWCNGDLDSIRSVKLALLFCLVWF